MKPLFLNLQKFNRRLPVSLPSVLVMSGALAMVPQMAQAGNTWTGGAGGTGTSWSDPLNWGGALPATTDGVYFNITGTGTGTKVISLDANQTIKTLNFNSYSQVPSFTIGNTADNTSGYSLTLTNVFRGDNNGNTQTIAAKVMLAGDSNWNIVNGYNGSVSVTGVVGSASDVTLVKEGSNSLTMSGANTFTGGVRSIGGSLVLTNANAYTGTTSAPGGNITLSFGAATATNIINSTSALELGGIRGGGSLTVNGRNLANVVNSQTLNGLTLKSGASSVSIANGIASGKTLVSLGAITRNIGSSLNFAQPTVNTTINAQNGFTTSAVNDATGILGGWATVGATNWATNDGTNVIAYTGYTDDTWAAGANTNVTTSATIANNSTTHSLRFNTAAANTVTLGGTNTLTSGGLLVSAAVGNNLTTITGGTLVGSSGGDLVVHQHNTSNILTIASNIADNTTATALTKSGGGTLNLTGALTHTGGTILNSGVLAFGPVTIIGSATNSTTTVTVASTAGLVVGQTVSGSGIPANTRIASINVDGIHFTLTQAATATNSTANLTYYTGGTTDALGTSGGITVNGGTFEMGRSSAAQTTSGAVVLASGTLNNGTITKSGANYDVRNGTINTMLAGSVGLDKTTSGTLTFTNTSGNTFTGDTTITEGPVVGTSLANVVSISGNLIVGSSGGGNAASYSNGANNYVNFNSSKNVTVYSNGSVSFGGSSQNLSGTINIIGGSVSGSFIYNQNATYNLTGGSLTGGFYSSGATYNILAASTTATVGIGTAAGNQIFNVADGAAATDLAYTGNLSGANNLTKNGAGLMAASGSSAYSGITTVSGGTLAVNTLANGGSASAIGQATNVATNLQLGTGTTLKYTGTGHSTDRLFTINGSATLEASGTGAVNFTNVGNIAYGTNNQTRTLVLGGTSTADNTLAAAIGNNGTGAVSLIKNDAGKWILSGANTYVGDTTVNSGTLVLTTAAPSALDDNSTVTIGTGAVLNLPVAGTDVVAALIINNVMLPDGLYGSNNTGGAITGLGKIQIGAAVGGDYGTWASANANNQAANLDYDLDGVLNGVEYFMGATGSTFTANPSVVTVGASRTITWPKDAAFNGSYAVKTSSDLIIWTDVTATPAVVDNGTSVVYTLPAPSGKIFARLAVNPN